MYYPLSQIKLNLFTTTNSNKCIIKSTSEPYGGQYWSTSDGKFFSGTGPQDTTSVELIKSSNKVFSVTSNTLSSPAVEIAYYPADPEINGLISPSMGYNTLNVNIVNNYFPLKNIDPNNLPTYKLPTSYTPTPTQDNYKIGEFTRYFCKKNNEIRYLEINKDTYDELNSQNPTYVWQLFTPIKYQWVISGDKKEVFKINKNVTKYMMDNFKLPFLDKFLNENYLRFWKSN